MRCWPIHCVTSVSAESAVHDGISVRCEQQRFAVVRMKVRLLVGLRSLRPIFSALDPRVFGQIGFWLIYVPIALVPIAIFFFSMLPTHNVLTNAKASDLKVVRTWPYNTTMLRTLFVSVMIPTVMLLIRTVLGRYVN
jgi:hypothetical protein